MISGSRYSKTLLLPLGIACLTLAAMPGCDDGSDGKDGKDGNDAITTTDRELGKSETPPGVVIEITGVSGATGSGGRFRPGDNISVTFTLEKNNGSRWDVEEMDFARMLVSGPTFNYQPIIYQVSDVADEAEENSDGSWTYEFASAIPATYLPPLNDTASFDADDGELQGQALLDGTYTIGAYFGWNYTVDSDSHREVGDTTYDILIGPGSVWEAREVVTRDNCNQCHQDLQFHGGLRRATTLCLLCHTAGSEDRNIPTVAGGTPGVSIEFKVMIHKIHNGSHLPSVHGVTTDANGDRDYTATPEPYQLVGFGDNVHDYSHVVFPAWPNLNNEMPRDAGYSSLGGPEQDAEDAILGGVTSCYLCHGDPDGTGPLAAPAQGDLIFSQPARRSCGSCHDDWVWDQPYTANFQTMPAQSSDAACDQCHPMTGSPLAIMDAHRHPLVDPAFAEGINFDIMDVAEGPGGDMDGTIDPGEKIAITFFLHDDLGADIDPTTVNSINTGLSGPTSNYNAFQFASIPTGLLTGPQPFTVNLPGRVYFEYVGDATSGADVFTTNFAPHLAPTLPTTVSQQTAPGGSASSFLAADVDAPVNFITVVDGTGFARDQIIVIDGSAPDREYLQIQFVDGNRLWFSSPQSTAYPPGPQRDHLAGVTVEEVTLDPLTEGVDYDLDAATGTITETGGFLDGAAIVVDYTSDYVVPGVYPVTLNDGPDLGEVRGSWTGKSLVDGTYSLTMWARRNLTLDLFGESNSYPELARAVRADFLVGDAATIEPYELISSADNCYSCHVDLAFHGNNRRGWESCLACHGAAGTGDRTRYVAANAPETSGVSVNFRELLHRMHMGADLENPLDYVVVGFGFGYPNNFSEHTFEEIVFPAMPSGTQDCSSCHGDASTAWLEPSDLDHPTEQLQTAQEWRQVCGACHDSQGATAHIESQTSPVDGSEACSVCHAPGEEHAVDVMHKIR